MAAIITAELAANIKATIGHRDIAIFLRGNKYTIGANAADTYDGTECGYLGKLYTSNWNVEKDTDEHFTLDMMIKDLIGCMSMRHEMLEVAT